MSDSDDTPPEDSKVETETFRRLERLRELRIEHRDQTTSSSGCSSTCM